MVTKEELFHLEELKGAGTKEKASKTRRDQMVNGRRLLKSTLVCPGILLNSCNSCLQQGTFTEIDSPRERGCVGII